MPLRSPASRDPSTGAGGTLGAGAGEGAEGLRQPCHLVLGLLALGAGSCQVPSQTCSAGAAGRGAQGPPAHSGAAASYACHRCLEVPARPLVWLSTSRGPGPGRGHPPSRHSPVVPSEGPCFALLAACWEGAGEGRGILQLPATSRLFPRVGSGRLACQDCPLAQAISRTEEVPPGSTPHTPSIPLGDPLLQSSVSTCPRHRGTTAPSTSVQQDPPSLSLQQSGGGARGQKEEPLRSLLQECLLASSKSRHAGPGHYSLLRGKCWLSYRSPQSSGLLPGHRALRDNRRSKARQGIDFALPPSSLCPLPVGLATSSAAGCSAHSSVPAPRLPLGTARQRRHPLLVWGVQIHLQA